MKRTRTDGLIDGTEMNDTNRQVPRRVRRIQTISLALLVDRAGPRVLLGTRRAPP